MELEKKGPPTPAPTPRANGKMSARDRRRDSISSQKSVISTRNTPDRETSSENDEKIIGAIQSHINRIDLLNE